MTKMKITWLTDTHLDFIHILKLKAFCQQIKADESSAVVITGDISNGKLLDLHLLALAEELAPKPVFFVCGNHDYYGSSLETVRTLLREKHVFPDHEKGWEVEGEIMLPHGAYWLGASGVIPLTKDIALVGHDGWYDGQYADWFRSQVWLNDYQLIQELARAGTKPLIYNKINELAREGAEYVTAQITKAFQDGFRKVVVLTHVPPFPENAVYNGKVSDEHWLPHFSSARMGNALLDIMSAHENQNKELLVLCGHSHGSAVYQPLPNLTVRTGEAEYRRCQVVDTFEI